MSGRVFIVWIACAVVTGLLLTLAIARTHAEAVRARGISAMNEGERMRLANAEARVADLQRELVLAGNRVSEANAMLADVMTPERNTCRVNAQVYELRPLLSYTPTP